MGWKYNDYYLNSCIDSFTLLSFEEDLAKKRNVLSCLSEEARNSLCVSVVCKKAYFHLQYALPKDINACNASITSEVRLKYVLTMRRVEF